MASPQTVSQLLISSASTWSGLYTVGASNWISTQPLIACNQNTSMVYFSVRVRPANATPSAAQTIYSNVLLDGNETKTLFVPVLAATDVIEVQATTTNVSFSLSGIVYP